MVRVSVCVCPRTLPAKMIVAPNSPTPRAKASTQPASSPPAASGSPIRQNVRAGPGAQRARGVGERRVDRLEGADRLADVERRGHEGDREDDRRLGEGQLDARVAQLGAEQPAGPDRGQQPDAGDGRGQHERQLDQRDDERAAREAAAAR